MRRLRRERTVSMSAPPFQGVSLLELGSLTMTDDSDPALGGGDGSTATALGSTSCESFGSGLTGGIGASGSSSTIRSAGIGSNDSTEADGVVCDIASGSGLTAEPTADCAAVAAGLAVTVLGRTEGVARLGTGGMEALGGGRCVLGERVGRFGGGGGAFAGRVDRTSRGTGEVILGELGLAVVGCEARCGGGGGVPFGTGLAEASEGSDVDPASTRHCMQRIATFLPAIRCLYSSSDTVSWRPHVRHATMWDILSLLQCATAARFAFHWSIRGE
ncbi:MAG TPA: hypothetical protein VI072_17720 [Polyangiaceae bacterium]